MPWPCLASAWALSPDEVVARMSEVSSLRAQRYAADLPALSDEVYREVASGSVYTRLDPVEGHRAQRAIGVGIVRTSIARMWSAVNDDQGKARVGSLAYAETLEGEPCGPDRKTFQYLPMSLMSDRWWYVHQRNNMPLLSASAGRVRETVWESVPNAKIEAPGARSWAESGTPLAFTQGAWFLVDLDGETTVVEYYSWADPGGMVPARLASRFAAANIEEILRTTEKLALDGPGCPLVP